MGTGRKCPILSDLHQFCPIFTGVLQTLENKAPTLFNFAPILSDLAFLQIRQNQTKSARPHWADPFWEFPKQYIVFPHGRTGNRTVTQMRHSLLVEGRLNFVRQSLASTLSAPRIAATLYCHPGRDANLVTPCLLTPWSDVPKTSIVRHECWSWGHGVPGC